MPDLEDLIRSTLDRRAPRPDPDPIVERVARRKRQVRLARRVQSATLAVVVVAGIGAGGYALARAFGIGEHPSPAVSVPTPLVSDGGPLPCGPDGTLAVVSQEGAAGTIRTVWRFTTNRLCRAEGYPSLEVHGLNGWLTPRNLHGGYQDIDQGPASFRVQLGQSLFFVTYWSDVTTNAGPCASFDRVRVTFPRVEGTAEMAATGCIGSNQLRVGPLSAAAPAG